MKKIVGLTFLTAGLLLILGTAETSDELVQKAVAAVSYYPLAVIPIPHSMYLGAGFLFLFAGAYFMFRREFGEDGRTP